MATRFGGEEARGVMVPGQQVAVAPRIGGFNSLNQGGWSVEKVVSVAGLVPDKQGEYW